MAEAVDLPAGERDERDERGRRLDAYMDAQIAEHLQDPREDLTTFLLEAELDGNRLAPELVRGTMRLLLIAGIDTTWSAIGASLRHLAQHPDDLARLVAELSLLPTASDHAYAPTTMARLVAKDHDFHGGPMKEGDWVLLPFPSATRDPKYFADDHQVIIDRVENRHVAVGLGIHRCVGSNLARMELNVALRELIRRFPAFELADPAGVRWATGTTSPLPIRVLARS